MAARDRFTVDLRCPKCGRSGIANASEDDYPFMRSPRFVDDELPDGFEGSGRAKTRAETMLKCECGEQFHAKKAKRPRDTNQLAKFIVDVATVGEEELAEIKRGKKSDQIPGKRGAVSPETSGKS